MYWAGPYPAGLAGFIVGMIAGALLNRFLLRHVPREVWRRDKELQLRYGALNWGFGIAGVFAAEYLVRLLAV